MGLRLSRRTTVISAVAAVALAAGGPALAYVLLSSNGAPGTFTADSLGSGTASGATISASVLRVSWTNPATQVTGAQFRVTRTTDSLPVCTVASTIFTCDDPNTIAPGTTYQYSVQTILSGTNWVSATQTVSATSADVFTVTAVGGGNIPSQTAGTSFTVQVTAKKGSALVTDTAYAGKATTISGLASSPSAAAPTYSPASGAVLSFSSGVATYTVTPKDMETATLTVSDTSFAAGTSNSFAVAAGVQNSLIWTTDAAGTTNGCSTGTQTVGNGGSRTFYVAALDAFENLTKQGASQGSVGITKVSGGGNAPNPTSLTIAANANPAVTGGTTLLSIPTGNPAATTYRATLGSLTVNCIIQR